MDPTAEAAPFLVIVFPADRTPAALGDLMQRVLEGLRHACGGRTPTLVKPDGTAVCLLVKGEFDRITAALDRAQALDTQWLVVKLAAPQDTCGLSTAAAWLARHLRP